MHKPSHINPYLSVPPHLWYSLIYICLCTMFSNVHLYLILFPAHTHSYTCLQTLLRVVICVNKDPHGMWGVLIPGCSTSSARLFFNMGTVRYLLFLTVHVFASLLLQILLYGNTLCCATVRMACTHPSPLSHLRLCRLKL